MRDEAMRLTVKDRNNKMNCKDMVLTSRYQQFSLPASIPNIHVFMPATGDF